MIKALESQRSLEEPFDVLYLEYAKPRKSHGNKKISDMGGNIAIAVILGTLVIGAYLSMLYYHVDQQLITHASTTPAEVSAPASSTASNTSITDTKIMGTDGTSYLSSS